MIVLRRSTVLLPAVSRRPPLARVGASGNDSYWVHTAKLLGYGVALPIGLGALLFGKFGFVFGVAVSASVLGNEIYLDAIGDGWKRA